METQPLNKMYTLFRRITAIGWNYCYLRELSDSLAQNYIFRTEYSILKSRSLNTFGPTKCINFDQIRARNSLKLKFFFSPDLRLNTKRIHMDSLTRVPRRSWAVHETKPNFSQNFEPGKTQYFIRKFVMQFSNDSVKFHQLLSNLFSIIDYSIWFISNYILRILVSCYIFNYH